MDGTSSEKVGVVNVNLEVDDDPTIVALANYLMVKYKQRAGLMVINGSGVTATKNISCISESPTLN